MQEIRGADHLRFRGKLVIGMMLVVVSLTGLGLFLTQRNLKRETEFDLYNDFQSTLATLHAVQEIRHSALSAQCRTLVTRPRIHAALEDDALDLLYPIARDELRDVIATDATHAANSPLTVLFYRFLDAHGSVIPAPDGADAGSLTQAEEARLSLPKTPEMLQLGYLARDSGSHVAGVDEVIAMPIISTDTGGPISALVLGFHSIELGHHRVGVDAKIGIQLQERLHLPSFTPAVQAALAGDILRAIKFPKPEGHRFSTSVGGIPHHVFFKQLNRSSLYPPAYEVVVYPLVAAQARQRRLQLQVLAAGAALLVGGLVASHMLAASLARPVERLELDSAEDRIRRARAEAVLEMTNRELQRAARFSADASHQLKTPITVLRAGLEELNCSEHLPASLHEEISKLVHQTYRLTNIVEDLLLLSRMDAGRVQINFKDVNLVQLIDGLMDDLSALPDELGLEVITDCPDLHVAGEKRYVALILQNLLENARKYNRKQGMIRVSCHENEGFGVLRIGNTGEAIPPSAQEFIFERFHRGSIGENVPGHGLGLNLARELARLHGGDLRLAESADDWTEFEVRFRMADAHVLPVPAESQRGAKIT